MLKHSSKRTGFRWMKAAATALLFFVLVFGVAHAQSVQDLQLQIQQLLQQIEQLQKQLDELPTNDTEQPPTPENTEDKSAPELATIDPFQTNLWYGMREEKEVVRLQNFLIEKGFLSSGLNTGNYFSLTQEAVKQYQRARNLPDTGYFGPLTRSQINSELQRELSEEEPKIQESPCVVCPDASIEPTPSVTSDTLRTSDILSEHGEFRVYRKPDYDISRIEKIIQEFINAERIQRGLVALTWNDDAAKVARLHSRELALDNTLTTDSSRPCSYPYIRHEGFANGFTVGDRLKNAGISYHIAGENIAAYSISEDFVYRYRAEDGPITCPPVPEYSQGTSGETQAEAQQRIQKDIDKFIDIVKTVPRVEWVNKEWLNAEEIAEQMVSGWMASEGHRRNILDNRFREGGVGIAEINDYFIATHILLKKF